MAALMEPEVWKDRTPCQRFCCFAKSILVPDQSICLTVGYTARISPSSVRLDRTKLKNPETLATNPAVGIIFVFVPSMVRAAFEQLWLW